jgi:tRNA modification GTPase
VVVLDGSAPLTADDRTLLGATASARRVIVVNKSDLAAAWPITALGGEAVVAASALTGAGLDSVRAAVVQALSGAETLRDRPLLTNVRHVELLARARAALERARDAAASGTPEEFVAADVGEARALLERVTGTRTADDVLDAIFSTFCIGK